MGNEKPLPPEARVLELLFGFIVSRSVSAVAELNVPDALRDGPRYYTDLAREVGADQRSLHRVMRVMTSVGVFDEPEPGTYALNDTSACLRSDAPTSLRDLAVTLTAPSHWDPWGRFTDTVRTGSSGAQLAFGTDLFSWFQRSENVEQWKIFNAAMTSFSSSTAEAAAEAYDFTRFEKIADIGGGHGLLLKTVLAKAPHAEGVLFDLPGVFEGFDSSVLGDRVTTVGGDFFEAVPPGCDCYVMKHIIHDWSDDHCRRILGNIAKAMTPEGRVLVIEFVMPESAEPHPAKFMDLNMLAVTEGGTERTEREFEELFASAGLKLEAIHPLTGSPIGVVEASRMPG